MFTDYLSFLFFSKHTNTNRKCWEAMNNKAPKGKSPYIVVKKGAKKKRSTEKKKEGKRSKEKKKGKSSRKK